ncbi:MAG TPA: thioredoxin [Cytophagales bacterium]|nr:thioredoxin [Cytophagales bacterium]
MASFQTLINSQKPVLVDFSAEWCGPCKTMAPILEEEKKIVGEMATIVKLDVDKNPTAAAAYKVQSVPTLMIFRNGQLKWRQSGVIQAKHLEKLLLQYQNS